MKILVLVLLAMLVLSEAKGGGWKPVNKKSEIRFNSTESTIEVKTELQLDSTDVRHLVIEFCSTECNGEHFQRIEIDYTRRPRRAGNAILDFTIKHQGTIEQDSYTQMTFGELVWTFNVISPSIIHVQCNQATCDNNISAENLHKIDRFRFGSGDTASLYYRVYSTDNGSDILPGENC